MTDNEQKDKYRELRKRFRSGYDRIPIEELDLSVAVTGRLKRNGVSFYGDIRHLPDWKIARMLLESKRYLAEVKDSMKLLEVKRRSSKSRTPIESIGLGFETLNILKGYSVDTVEDLVSISAYELLYEFVGIGPARLQHIRKKLKENGLSLLGDPKPDGEKVA